MSESVPFGRAFKDSIYAVFRSIQNPGKKGKLKQHPTDRAILGPGAIVKFKFF